MMCRSQPMRADDISARARRIHFSSLVFDTHADTPQRISLRSIRSGAPRREGCVDIPRLREGGVGAIFFALWVPVEITGAAATRRAFDLLAATVRQIQLHPGDLALATSSEEVRDGARGKQDCSAAGHRRRARHQQRSRRAAGIPCARRSLHDADAQCGDRLGGFLESLAAPQRPDGIRQAGDRRNEPPGHDRRCLPRFGPRFTMS